MKWALLLILIIEGAAFGYLYQTHPEALEDAIADVTNDPNGTRANLVKTSQKIDELTATANKLQDENDALKNEKESLKAQLNALAKQVDDLGRGPQKAHLVPDQDTSALPAQPNWVWNTSDGKVYKNVVITKIEADCVTILDDEGGALVPIETLPADIQKLLNYDPNLAAEAKKQRAKDDEASAVILAQQKAQGDALKQSQLVEAATQREQSLSDQKAADDKLTKDAQVAACQDKIIQLKTDLKNLEHPAIYNKSPDPYQISQTEAQITQYEQQLAQLTGVPYKGPTY